MTSRPLLQAASEGNIPLLKQLIDSDCDINATNKQGWTPLFCATENLHLSTISFLLQHRANVQHSSNDGMNVLHVLGENRSIDFPDTKNEKSQNKKELFKIWKLFIESGVSMVAGNEIGETPFHLVCLRGDLDVVKFLLNKGYVKNVNVFNNNGDTPLHYASRKGNKKIIDLLLKHGADLTLKSKFGDAIHVADDFHQEDIKKLLISLRYSSSIFLLDKDCFFLIFSYLQTPQSLCNLSLVCRAFNMISSSDVLWQPLGNPSWDKSPLYQNKNWKETYLTWIRNIPMRNNTNNIIKILLLGDIGVGKSSLLHRYTDDTFVEVYLATIGVEFKIKRMQIGQTQFKIQVWDTATGPQRFRTVSSSYYRGLHGICLVFDLCNHISFENISNWIREATVYGPNNVAKILVGAKCDLVEKRKVTREEAEELASNLSLPYMECSSKTGESVETCFVKLVHQALFSSQEGLPAYIPDCDILGKLRSEPREESKDKETVIVSTCEIQ